MFFKRRKRNRKMHRKRHRESRTISVLEMQVNEKGVIAQLNTTDQQKLRKLMAMGIIPGVEVKVIQKFPSYLLQVGKYTMIAVDNDIAGEIFVKLEQEEQI